MEPIIPPLLWQPAHTVPMDSRKKPTRAENGPTQPLTCRQSSTTIRKIREEVEPASHSTRKSRTKLPDIYQPRFFRKAEAKESSKTTRTNVEYCVTGSSKVQQKKSELTLPQLAVDLDQVKYDHRHFRQFIRKVLSRRLGFHRRTDSNEAENKLQQSSPHHIAAVPAYPLPDDLLCLELELSGIDFHADPPTPTLDSLQLIDW